VKPALGKGIGQKKRMKKHLKGLGVFTPHILLQDEKSLPGVPEFASCFAFHPT
jgi:hypothetical protein